MKWDRKIFRKLGYGWVEPVGTKVVTDKGLKQQPFPEKTGPLIHTFGSFSVKILLFYYYHFARIPISLAGQRSSLLRLALYRRQCVFSPYKKKNY
jgi:hypothetical protein